MATEEKKKEILTKLRTAVIQYDEDSAKEGAQEALKEGIEANDAIFNGLVSGMEEVGRMFEAQEYFVPELLMCADALYAGLDILKPLLSSAGVASRGRVVIGSVQGDLHDIGKNLVGIMLRGAGFEVIDLGNDVAASRFVAEAKSHDASVIGMSALLTTTMPVMKEVVDGLDPSLPRLLDYGSKTDPSSPYWTDVRFREARTTAPGRFRSKDSKAQFS